MSAIIIDKELCIGCGQCVKDCVGNHIELSEGKALMNSDKCIECGHCYAICPVGAVSMEGYNCEGLEAVKALSDYDSDELLLAMKSRRSIRRFKDKEVSQEDILRIIEAGRYCPTACNAQDVSFVVLTKCINQCEAAAVEMFRRAQRMAGGISSLIKNSSIDDHFFFKGAPLAILTVSKHSGDANLASSYMELMAASLGLGAFYSGFFVFAANHNKTVKKLLDLPEGSNVVSCLMIGHPDVDYKRIPPRKPAKLIIR